MILLGNVIIILSYLIYKESRAMLYYEDELLYENNYTKIYLGIDYITLDLDFDAQSAFSEDACVMNPSNRITHK